MSAPFSVRMATADDHQSMVPLFERFYREEGFDEAAAGVAKNLRGVLERLDTGAFLADSMGSTIGAAAISTSFGLEAGLYAELEDLYVVPEWRGRGVASDLVEAAIVWARERGCRDVEIVLTPQAQAQVTLCKWYAARGFVDTGRRILERRVD